VFAKRRFVWNVRGSWNIKVFGLLGGVNRNLRKSCGAKNTLRKISEGLVRAFGFSDL